MLTGQFKLPVNLPACLWTVRIPEFAEGELANSTEENNNRPVALNYISTEKRYNSSSCIFSMLWLNMWALLSPTCLFVRKALFKWGLTFIKSGTSPLCSSYTADKSKGLF